MALEESSVLYSIKEGDEIFRLPNGAIGEMDNKVYIVRCPDYEQAEEKLTQLMTMMNGIESYISPNEKIVLKINLLQAQRPEKAVTTHPILVAAVARMVKKAGGHPIIADSPGAGYKRKALDRIYRTCGIYEAAEDSGIEVNLDTTYRIVSYPEGKLIKRFEVISPVLEADGIFNLCKLKTHVFMHMTGAIKNNFGVIPGTTKPGYHMKLHDKGRFANMLLDLAGYVSPRLSIMDAVVALEGEGPGSSGDPRHVGLLLAARSPLALDVVAGEIIGLKREENPVIMEAEKRGLYPTRIEEIQVLGAEISDLPIPDFKFPATIYEGTGFEDLPWWQRLLKPFFKDGMSVKPVTKRERCTACGVCHKACPVKAITVVSDTYAQIDEKKCIRCYCCHEMCQHNAIKLQKSLLYRLTNRLND